MSRYTAALEQLEEVVGATHLLTDTHAMGRHAVDGQPPLSVARPGTEEEVVALLRVAQERTLSVLPRGGGRHLHLGGVPAPIGMLLSLARLDQVVHYDANDLTITVQAGLTLRELRHLVAAHGQMLPLDPPGPDDATIGGVAAANLSGPLRLRYGAPRDLILGLRVALSTGEVIRTGARTVKNVAGYDVTKLMVGSYGSLGAILEVTLRLVPAPEERALFAASLPPARVQEVLPALVGSHLDIATCDLLSFRAAEGMKLLLPVALRPEHVVLFVGAMGPRESVARQEREIKALLPEGAARLSREEVWARLRDLPYPASPEQCVVRASVPIASAVSLVEAVMAQPGWSAIARAGDGVVYAQGPEEGRALTVIRATAQQLGGYAVLESGSPELKRSFPVWGELPNLDLMRALKQSLDPTGLMGCGRLV